MELVTTSLQTIQPNEDVLFDAISVPGPASALWRQGSGIVTLRGLSRCSLRARFKVNFGGNVGLPTTATVEPIIFALVINGEPIAASRMISTPAAVEEFNNVFRELYIDVPAGCCTSIAIRNVGTQPSDLDIGGNLIVERVA